MPNEKKLQTLVQASEVIKKIEKVKQRKLEEASSMTIETPLPVFEKLKRNGSMDMNVNTSANITPQSQQLKPLKSVH